MIQHMEQTTNDTTLENVCLIAYLELYIRKNHSSAILRLYTSDCFTRLVHHWKLTPEKLDISSSIIIHQDVLFHYWDCTSGRLYISLSKIAHIGTACTTIGIVYLEGCTSAHKRSNTLVSFFRNAPSSG